MRDVWKFLQFSFMIIGGWIGYIIGDFDGFMFALVVFMTLDYLTGVVDAIMKKRLSSDIGFKGLLRKMMIFVIVIIGNVIDVYIIKEGATIRTAVIFFYLANEGISILENVTEIGLPIPEKIKDVLLQIKGGADNEDH